MTGSGDRRWDDRVAGVMLGTAVGDALGAGYEYGSAPLGPEGSQMIGGGLGGFAPGQWTDDTSMAWCVLDVAASGRGLLTDEALSEVARNFGRWYDSGPPDIGNQTAAVLRAAGPAPTAAAAREAAEEHFRRSHHSAGNGSLMRTAPVALAHLGDTGAIVRAATAVSDLTHSDPRTAQACVLWSSAIDRAVREQVLDLRGGLVHLDGPDRDYWEACIDEAEQGPPERFRRNGWVVTALQSAWSAIRHTPIPAADPGRHLADSLVTAIGIGGDTDTVAAIAGGLLGARWGASAVPAQWRDICHGYPGLTGEDLVELAHAAAVGDVGTVVGRDTRR
ncbi:ADP-ribosylglycohydrolase family protein [uncultured Dietzia sp.]|uniref:ADP-ribosylglycohydrolase family protein n=1 Tax=uncultured Dietzia sp. TaxID=395519 RepID=UPI0030F99CEE